MHLSDGQYCQTSPPWPPDGPAITIFDPFSEVLPFDFYLVFKLFVEFVHRLLGQRAFGDVAVNPIWRPDMSLCAVLRPAITNIRQFLRVCVSSPPSGPFPPRLLRSRPKASGSRPSRPRRFKIQFAPRSSCFKLIYTLKVQTRCETGEKLIIN